MFMYVNQQVPTKKIAGRENRLHRDSSEGSKPTPVMDHQGAATPPTDVLTYAISRTHTCLHTYIYILSVSYAQINRMYRETKNGFGKARGAMAVHGLFLDLYTRPSSARPKRITEKGQRGKKREGAKKRC